MHKLHIILLATLLLLMLPGCSILQPEDSASQDLLSQDSISQDAFSQDAQIQLIKMREQQLGAIRSWRLDGRFSMVTDAESWSGKLHWFQQSNADYLIQFSAPSGQGAMQLLGNDELAELRLANGDSFRATDADALLRQETDWELPVNSLWYWIRGLPDPKLPQKIELDPENLIVKLEQESWTVNYNSYHQYERFSLPRKITVENETTKLRLIIMNWITE
jgi:outer membrane lipoprotein LolB